MRKVSDLGTTEQRVLGALLEKEQATPDYYPLTVNALIAACNQKSNRFPVMSLSETEIIETLESLRRDVLVWRADGARSERWSQSISRRLELDPEEKAILTLLLLRGPQTPGELRTRSGRLHAFDDLGEVEAALGRMRSEARELVAELPRGPGQKETRWAHQLGDLVEPPAAMPHSVPQAPSPPPARVAMPDNVRNDRNVRNVRIAALEERVEALERVVSELREKLGDLLE